MAIKSFFKSLQAIRKKAPKIRKPTNQAQIGTDMTKSARRQSLGRFQFNVMRNYCMAFNLTVSLDFLLDAQFLWIRLLEAAWSRDLTATL